MPPLDCQSLIDHRRYPIDEPGSRLREQLVRDVRDGLERDGCAVIRGFYSGEGLDALKSEALARVGDAYYSGKNFCNVYLGEGNPDRPPEHPQNIFLERSNGFVSSRSFDETTISSQFYAWPPLKDFIADCLAKDELHVYDDPISNMIINLSRPGEKFNWHFDTNEFTITMLLQAPESGGRFEYVPNLRNQQDECYDDVKRVLDGERDRVEELELNEGDMQLFLGRFSLHRVTENTGNRDRVVLIMSFAEKPGMVGNKTRIKDLYGRTTEAHEQNEKTLVRADTLLD